MGKCQCQVPSPPTPFHKRSRAKDYIILSTSRHYLRPHIVFKLTDEINMLWYKQVLSALENSMFMGVRYNRLSRSVTHGRYPDLNM